MPKDYKSLQPPTNTEENGIGSHVLKSVYQSGAQFLGSMFRGSGDGIKTSVQQQYSLANALNPASEKHPIGPTNHEQYDDHRRKEPDVRNANGVYGNLYASSVASSISSAQSYKSAASAVPANPARSNPYPIFGSGMKTPYMDNGTSSSNDPFMKKGVSESIPRTGSMLSKHSVGSLKVPSAKDMPGKGSAIPKCPPSHSSKSNTLSSKGDRYAGLKKTGTTAKAFASTEKRILQENDATAAQEAMYALDGLNVKIATIYKGKKYKNELFKKYNIDSNMHRVTTLTRASEGRVYFGQGCLRNKECYEGKPESN